MTLLFVYAYILLMNKIIGAQIVLYLFAMSLLTFLVIVQNRILVVEANTVTYENKTILNKTITPKVVVAKTQVEVPVQTETTPTKSTKEEDFAKMLEARKNRFLFPPQEILDVTLYRVSFEKRTSLQTNTADASVGDSVTFFASIKTSDGKYIDEKTVTRYSIKVRTDDSRIIDVSRNHHAYFLPGDDVGWVNSLGLQIANEPYHVYVQVKVDCGVGQRTSALIIGQKEYPVYVNCR